MDLRQLLAGLEEYHRALIQQVATVEGEFAEVSQTWLGLSECFEGDAADEFRPLWEQTATWFRDYAERTTAINAILADRIEALRRAEQTAGLGG